MLSNSSSATPSSLNQQNIDPNSPLNTSRKYTTNYFFYSGPISTPNDTLDNSTVGTNFFSTPTKAAAGTPPDNSTVAHKGFADPGYFELIDEVAGLGTVKTYDYYTKGEGYQCILARRMKNKHFDALKVPIYSFEQLFETRQLEPELFPPSIKESNNSSDDDDRTYKEVNGETVKLFRFIISKQKGFVGGENEASESYSHCILSNIRGSIDQPVQAAGTVGINKNGRLVYLDNKTGHYRVPPTTLDEVVLPYLALIIDPEGEKIDFSNLYLSRCTAKDPDKEPEKITFDLESLLPADRWLAFKQYFQESKIAETTFDTWQDISSENSPNERSCLRLAPTSRAQYDSLELLSDFDLGWNQQKYNFLEDENFMLPKQHVVTAQQDDQQEESQKYIRSIFSSHDTDPSRTPIRRRSRNLTHNSKRNQESKSARPLPDISAFNDLTEHKSEPHIGLATPVKQGSTEKLPGNKRRRVNSSLHSCNTLFGNKAEQDSIEKTPTLRATKRRM